MTHRVTLGVIGNAMEDSTCIVADGGWLPRKKMWRRWTRAAFAVCIAWIPVSMLAFDHFWMRSGDASWSSSDSLAVLGGSLQIGWGILTVIISRREPAREVTEWESAECSQDPRKLY